MSIRRSRGRFATAATVVTLGAMVLLGAPPASAQTVSPVATPTDGTAGDALAGVACASASQCFAVGSTGGATTLIEEWSGSSWAVVASPNGPNGFDALTGAACAGPTRCFAVGNSAGANGSSTLIDEWDGSAWSVVPSPNNSGGAGTMARDILDGVACPAANLCFAVGTWSAASPATPANQVPTNTLVEEWDGSTWSVVASPNGPDQNNVLAGVACPSPTSCWAVGSSSQTAAGANGSSSLIEQWVGSAWAVVGSHSAPGSSPQASLAGVACPSPGFCWAVGSSGSTTLVEGWDGSSWSTTASPNVGFVNALSGVACPSAGQCYAVGSFTPTSSTNAYALIEEWNGSSWSVLYPGSGAPTQGDLAGAGCASINRCWAVGSAAGSGTMLLAITSQAPASAISLTRIAGKSRDLTSVAASQSAFPAAGSARAVVLASDADFPDALAGTPLAVAKAGPLLLTTPTSLDAAVGSEISRVLPRGDAVYVLGGDAALSASVSQSVAAMGYQIVRLAGSDRYGTALAVAGRWATPRPCCSPPGSTSPTGSRPGRRRQRWAAPSF